MSKSITKRLRLTPSEWEQIQRILQEKGGITFSQYALDCMLQKKKSKKEAVAVANKAYIAEFARWGNNLNQVAKHLNTNKGGLDRVGLEMLSRIEAYLKDLWLLKDLDLKDSDFKG